MDSPETLINQLLSLTLRWNTHEGVPRSQQSECKRIGARLNAIGGMDLMQRAYQAAHDENRSASVVQAYWHGIGDWQW